MKTASFTDGNISHAVHTRAEALHLTDRYWPEDSEVKVAKLAHQFSMACKHYGQPCVIVWRDDTSEELIGELAGRPREIAALIHKANLCLVEGLMKEAPE